MNLLKRKRVLVPLTIISMLIAAYAQNAIKDKGTITGYLQPKELDEISGIVASVIHPGIYYVHNDSGDTSRFFAITPEGKLKATYYFKGMDKPLGVTDCEDISMGPGPVKGKSYIYLGDIGDNNAVRTHLTIYRFEEPENMADSVSTLPATVLYLKYPDGPKDAETLMTDPIDELLYVVSKRGATVNVYTTPLNYKDNDTVTLEKRATLRFGGLLPFKWITAGDISKNGDQVLLKNYHNVYYWKRAPGEHIWTTMTRKPANLYYKNEKQGEAIGFSADDKGYYTTSEGQHAPIYYYHLPQ